MKNFGKSLLIAFLMFLAIYQTGKLWFEGFSDHNFFSFIGNQDNASKDITYTLDRLVINLGDNKIVCLGSDIYSSKYKKIFDKGISEAVTSGAPETNKTLDWNKLLQNRAIIYEYNCSFAGSDIGSLFDIKAPGSEAISVYDRIILLPAATKDKMEVIFYNSEMNTAGVYTLTDNDIIARCYNASSTLNNENSTQYISTLLNGFTIFSQNQFIPLLDDSKTYSPVECHQALTDNSDIERNADLFFNNSMNRWTSRSNGVYTFSDENTVVKYSSNGIFEYSGYNTAAIPRNDFYSNYSAALAILSKDTYIKNEYYLSSYETDEYGNYNFYFNYKLNGLSVVPSEQLKSSLGINSFIEITSVRGRVSKFKKYAYIFRELDNTQPQTVVDYISAIDSLYVKLYGDGETKPVEKIKLQYIADGSRFYPQWSIKIDGSYYTVPATISSSEQTTSGGETIGLE